MNDKNGGWDSTLWKKKNMENLPQQENGYDCGMFMLMYADFCCRPITNIKFNQRNNRKRQRTDMPRHSRKHMTLAEGVALYLANFERDPQEVERSKRMRSLRGPIM